MPTNPRSLPKPFRDARRSICMFSLTGFNTIDITIIVLVLLMAVKGLMNGFLREIFGFVGLIGGVFVASRGATLVAHYIDTHLFHLENFAVLKLIGFLILLALAWGTSAFVGNLIVGVSREGSHHTLDRSFGCLVAGIKYFLIFSLIVSTLFRSPLIKENMTQTIRQSKLYPTLDSIGSTLINLSPLGKNRHIKKP